MRKLIDKLKGRFTKQPDTGYSNEHTWGHKSFADILGDKGGESKYKANAKKYWELYRTDPIVSGAINSITFKILGRGIRVVGPNVETNMMLQEKLSSLFEFRHIVAMIRNTLIFGDAFAEIVTDSLQEVTSVTPRNPIDFSIKNGKFLFNDKLVNSEKLLHLQLFEDLDESGVSGSGISLISFAYVTSKDRRKVYTAIVKAIERHGTPKWHTTVSPDERGQYPSKTELSEISSDFKQIESKSDFVTTDKYVITKLDSTGIPSIKDYQDFMISEAAAGFLTPVEVLGIGSKTVTHATAKERMKMYNMIIVAFQTILSNEFTNQLLRKFVTDKDTKIEFNLVDDENLLKNMEYIKYLMTPDNPFVILTKEEIRELIGFANEESIEKPDEETPEKPEKLINEKSLKRVDLDKLYDKDFKTFSAGWEKVRHNIKDEIFKTVESGKL